MPYGATHGVVYLSKVGIDTLTTRDHAHVNPHTHAADKFRTLQGSMKVSRQTATVSQNKHENQATQHAPLLTQKGLTKEHQT